MALGPRDTGQLVQLTGWDAAALRNFENEAGTNFGAVVAQINGALAGLAGELTSDPLWAGLVSYGDDPEVEYRQGGSNGMERYTEYGRPDAKRADTDGHMIPFEPWDRALGWTWNYLRRARASQVQADIADAIGDVRNRWRIQILSRLFKRGDDSGASKGLGAAGLSPGFATTAASTGVDFTPPTVGGTSFSNTHEHYVGITGGAFTAAVFSDAKDELREHGHEAPYEFMIGGSGEAQVRALTGFVPTASSLIAYGAMQDRALLNPMSDSNGGYYIGTIDDFAVRVVQGVPQYYGFGWKSYGLNSQRNPLRIRLAKGLSSPLVQAFPDPRSGAGAVYPLQYLMLFTEFGVGVGDRTNGTARYVNSASWSDAVVT